MTYTRQEFKEALVGKYLVHLTENSMERGRVTDVFFTAVATTANVRVKRDDGYEFSMYIEERHLEEIAQKKWYLDIPNKYQVSAYYVEGGKEAEQ